MEGRIRSGRGEEDKRWRGEDKRWRERRIRGGGEVEGEEDKRGRRKEGVGARGYEKGETHRC